MKGFTAYPVINRTARQAFVFLILVAIVLIAWVTSVPTAAIDWLDTTNFKAIMIACSLSFSTLAAAVLWSWTAFRHPLKFIESSRRGVQVFCFVFAGGSIVTIPNLNAVLSGGDTFGMLSTFGGEELFVSIVVVLGYLYSSHCFTKLYTEEAKNYNYW